MKRRAIVALCVVLMTVHVPSGGAEPLELVWEHDLGPGLITTSLWLTVTTLYVRTSKSWSVRIVHRSMRSRWTGSLSGIERAPPPSTT